ncbi:hypothetical protein Tco_0247530 [Tanacetum coccineum]
MVHLAPRPTQEESNAFNNATALERAWFSLARGALAQTDILERFEHLQAEFDRLAKTHADCGDTVRQLVDAREASRQSLRLYLEMAERFKKVKNDHASCTKKIQLLEDQNGELSQANKDQALRIRELEDTLVKKDSALVYAKRINAEMAQEKEKLVAQLSKTKMEKFDCIPIQAGWAKRLAKERSKEDLLELMSSLEDFDVYVDIRIFLADLQPMGQVMPPSHTGLPFRLLADGHLFQGRLLYSFWHKAIFFPPCKPSRSETYVSASVKEIDYVQLGIVNQAELKLQPRAFFSFCTAAYTKVKILLNLLRT